MDPMGVFFLAIPLTVSGAAALWRRSTHATETLARSRDRLWARLSLGLAALELLMALSVAIGLRLH